MKKLLRRATRFAAKTLLWLLGLVVLVALAWVISNNRWVDARPRAEPEALKPAPPGVAAGSNPYFAFMGLDVPAGMDPQVEGMRQWQASEPGDNPPVQSEQAGAAGAAGASTPGTGVAGAGPTDAGASRVVWQSATAGPAYAAWNCQANETDCVAQWWPQADALEQAMAHSLPGERCEVLVQPGMVFEEPLPTPSPVLRTRQDSYAARPMAPGIAQASKCLKWLHVRAVLAARDGQPELMMRRLEQADALTTATLKAGRSLVAMLIGGIMAQRQWHVVTDMAARMPGMTPRLAALMGPLPLEATDATAWMKFEATFSRQMLREAAGLPCETKRGAWALPAFAGGEESNCVDRFFSMHQATQQRFDAFWRAALTRAADGPLALVDWELGFDPDHVRPRVWRNTLGQMLVDAGVSSYPLYIRRQANLLLHHEAARLALAARDVPVAERAAWLQRQPMDARLRERLSISAKEVQARGWPSGKSTDTTSFPIPSGVTIANIPVNLPADDPDDTSVNPEAAPENEQAEGTKG